MLTPKQEKFVQNLISGMSQREAYQNSYNASKMKDSTIDRCACELMKNPKITTRYQELINEAKDDAVMTAKERMIWLTKVINGDIKNNNNEAFIGEKVKALDVLNKMTGEYTQKVKIDNPKGTKILSSICKQLGGKSE